MCFKVGDATQTTERNHFTQSLWNVKKLYSVYQNKPRLKKMKFSLSLSLPFPKVDLESIFVFLFNGRYGKWDGGVWKSTWIINYHSSYLIHIWRMLHNVEKRRCLRGCTKLMILYSTLVNGVFWIPASLYGRIIKSLRLSPFVCSEMGWKEGALGKGSRLFSSSTF